MADRVIFAEAEVEETTGQDLGGVSYDLAKEEVDGEIKWRVDYEYHDSDAGLDYAESLFLSDEEMKEVDSDILIKKYIMSNAPREGQEKALYALAKKLGVTTKEIYEQNDIQDLGDEAVFEIAYNGKTYFVIVDESKADDINLARARSSVEHDSEVYSSYFEDAFEVYDNIPGDYASSMYGDEINELEDNIDNLETDIEKYQAAIPAVEQEIAVLQQKHNELKPVYDAMAPEDPRRDDTGYAINDIEEAMSDATDRLSDLRDDIESYAEDLEKEEAKLSEAEGNQASTERSIRDDPIAFFKGEFGEETSDIIEHHGRVNYDEVAKSVVNDEPHLYFLAYQDIGYYAGFGGTEIAEME